MNLNLMQLSRSLDYLFISRINLELDDLGLTELRLEGLRLGSLHSNVRVLSKTLGNSLRMPNDRLILSNLGLTGHKWRWPLESSLWLPNDLLIRINQKWRLQTWRRSLRLALWQHSLKRHIKWRLTINEILLNLNLTLIVTGMLIWTFPR